MAPRTKGTTGSATENGNRPTRTSTSATGIPARTTRQGSTYPEWAPEVEDAKAHLGEAFEYADTDNVGTIAAALRRIYGVVVKVRNFDKETKRGTLWMEYPALRDEDGTIVGPDEDKVAEIKAKYAKKD